MRDLMRENENLQENKEKQISEYKQQGNILVEKWSKKPGIGEGLQESFDSNPDKVRGLGYALENQEAYLKKLTETQISTAFSTTPENVMRIVRLGYPNSVRGELFLEWAMQTARDSIYYLFPQYSTTNRGATINTRTIESAAYRYGSEVEEEANGTLGDGSTTTFTGVCSVTPVIPYSLRIYVDNVLLGNDDGKGLLTGSGQNIGDNITNGVSAGTIDYTLGIYSVTFSTAPAIGTTILIEYKYNSEVAADYGQLGQIELQLRDYQFRIRPYPLGVSWSKMTELLLGTTLNIDAEEALIRGAADEVKKGLDFMALRLAYRAAKANTAVAFDASAASAGEDSAILRAQAITNAINRAGNIMYGLLQRGGVTKIVGGPNAVSYLELHKKFTDAGKQPSVGAFKTGSLGNIDVYKAPVSIIPDNELVCIYRNDYVPEDVSIAFGSLIPLYQTPKLEFKQLYSELGLAHFGDAKVLQSKYLVRIVLNNLSNI
jgi:hypothetical protein